MNIYYGTDQDSIDVTEKTIITFLKDDILVIPENRNFNIHFGDPCPNIVKNLYIIYNNIIIIIPEYLNEYHINLNIMNNNCIYFLHNTKEYDNYITSLNIVNVKIYYTKEEHLQYLNNIIDDSLYLTINNLTHINNKFKMVSLNNNVYNDNKKIYLPYQNNKIENIKLFELSQHYKYEIGILGSYCDRRLEIFHKLKDKYNIIFTENSDIKIGQCKILLNMFEEDTHQTFNHHIIDRWIFVNKIIISEENLDANLNSDIFDLILWSSYDKIVNMVESFICDEDKLILPSDNQKLNKLTSKISIIRQYALHDFLNSS